MKARLRERWGLAATGVALMVLFEGLPMLDLQIALMLHTPEASFFWRDLVWVQASYRGTPWIGRLMFVITILILLAAAWKTFGVPRQVWRRAAALHLVMLIGLGLVVHAVFKEQWGRPRPYELKMFAGEHQYVPAMRPVGPCQSNCSFVSGHAATGFSLVALGMFAPRRRRQQWFAIAGLCGVFIGLGRMVQGGHFLSDILFAGWLMWATTALIREIWLRMTLRRRWRARRRGAALHGTVGVATGLSG
jgi:membrane-associated PAP2 superfamily phosphatase